MAAVGLDYHKSELESEDLKETLKEYNKIQGNSKRNYIPKWYSLNGGPKSINQLAKYVARKEPGGKDLVANVYSFLSTSAHNYMELNTWISDHGELYIKPIRGSFDSNKNDYNLGSTKSLLAMTIANFTLNVCPENIDELKLLVSQDTS